jgi:hypothetical protein
MQGIQACANAELRKACRLRRVDLVLGEESDAADIKLPLPTFSSLQRSPYLLKRLHVAHQQCHPISISGFPASLRAAFFSTLRTVVNDIIVGRSAIENPCCPAQGYHHNNMTKGQLTSREQTRQTTVFPESVVVASVAQC